MHLLAYASMLEYIILSSAISFVSSLILTRLSISILKAKGSVVVDYHKPNKPLIPRPGGYAIILSLSLSYSILFAITLNYSILAVLLAAIIAFIIGYIDDKRVMRGYYKPLGLIIASLPIIFLNAYDYNLEFPLVGSVRIPILYIGVIVIMIVTFGNTINSIDVFNGVASMFIVIASIPLIIALSLSSNYELLASASALLASASAFYIYHRYPSKIFPGDSGTLTLGVAYASIAITAELEIIAIISLLPAIINSFFFLSSVKRIVEHREIKSRPTILLDDYRIAASKDKHAPITLVRLIVASKPMYEHEIINRIIALAAFSSILAIITIFMM